MTVTTSAPAQVQAPISYRKNAEMLRQPQLDALRQAAAADLRAGRRRPAAEPARRRSDQRSCMGTGRTRCAGPNLAHPGLSLAAARGRYGVVAPAAPRVPRLPAAAGTDPRLRARLSGRDGGGEIPFAAYDPIFFSHRAMIDRIWRLCQLRHPTAGMPPELLAEALPFNITVRQTVNVNWLGYDYASFSSRTTVARSCDGDHCGPRAALRRASDVVRADLTFYGLDHSGPSYGVRVFLDLPDATTETPLDDSHYADSFTVFGHGGCFGDEGHCDVRPAVTTFDRRPPHQLVLAVRVLTCTKPIKRLIADGRASVNATVVAIVRESPLADPQAADDLPHADQIALHRYE